MSVINQMLKDLEQRRAQSFDGEAGILDDLAVAGSQSGRSRGLKLILLLLIIVIAILAWLLWERFTQGPQKEINLAKQSTVTEQQPLANKQIISKEPVIIPETASIKTVAETEARDTETEKAAVLNAKAVIIPNLLTPEDADRNKTQDSVTEQLPLESDVVARIDHISPEMVLATGERSIMRVYGEGFVQPFEVFLEWSKGQASRILEGWQVDLISENEMHLHFNPGTQTDEWTVRVEPRGGAGSQRFSFKVQAPDVEIQQASPQPPATVKPEQASLLSKTRRELTPIDQASGLFAEASDLLKRGQSAEAKEVLRKVISLNDAHTRARELLASLLFQNKQYAEAVEILEAGITHSSGHIPYSLLLARVHMEQGRDSDAIKILESQKPLARNNSDYYALLAALYQRAARHADAAKVYRGLVDVFPGRAVWWMGLGISMQSLNNSEAALEAYQRASRAQGLQPEVRKFVQQRIRQLGG